jgi:hypothetical protein
MIVIAGDFCFDAVMVQEFSGVPRVFASNDVNFAQHPKRAMSHVFKIANRRGDDVESSRHAGYSVIKAEQLKARAREGDGSV